MKKKLLALLMASVVAVSVCACGNTEVKDAANEAEEATNTVTDEVQTGEEGAASTQKTEEIKVSEREDYVPIENLTTEDYITLADYTSMTFQAVKPEVTDQKIEDYINMNMLTYYVVTDRAVEEGDAVKIDYEGKKEDGVAFEGGTAQGYVLHIGSGQFIDGFEDGLIGVMPGETVDLNLTFPEVYHSEELAGAEVVFTVTVHEIQKSTEYATVTPEELSLMGSTYTSKEELWTAATGYVEEETTYEYQINVANAVLDKLMAESECISLPELLVEEEIQNNNAYVEALCNYYGIDIETYAGMPMDEYNSQVRQSAEETVKFYLIMESIARKEGVEVTEEMLLERAAEEAVIYQYESAEALIEDVGRTTYRMVVLQDELLEKLVNAVNVEALPEE